MKTGSCLALLAFVALNAARPSPVNAGDDEWWNKLPLKGVRVVVHTEGDDKDSEESVTLRVFYGPFTVEHVEPAGQQWNDQTDKSFDIDLSTPHPPAGATFELKVSKSREGSPTGKGWKASFEMFALPEAGGEMQLYINGDRNRPRSATFVMGDGDQNPNDVVVMTGAKVVPLAGGRSSTASRVRGTVRFDQSSTRQGSTKQTRDAAKQ
jgi:hypothetical protein